jgi:outer membrane protein OmpA-like peptidoglycan-associated protein
MNLLLHHNQRYKLVTQSLFLIHMIKSKNSTSLVKIGLALFTFQLLSVGILAKLPDTLKTAEPKPKTIRPKWYFGQSAGMNLNAMKGNAQDLNEYTYIPTAFASGEGKKPYASVFIEYMAFKRMGFLLNAAYDNRGGKFKEVMAPCDCPQNLTTNLGYAAIEPSIKLLPFKGNFFVFGGPTFLFSINKSFKYTQLYQTDIHDDFGQITENVIGGQAGIGYDIFLSSKDNLTQIVLTPFASYHTKLGPTTRPNETWEMQTIRVGLSLKIGARKKVIEKVDLASTDPLASGVLAKKEVEFTVKSPKWVTQTRRLQEVLPLRNSIFFDSSSSEIPKRYKQLSESAAVRFTEAQVVQEAPEDLSEGRSARQLAVYHNILNITGDRLRSNPKSSIYLVGSSDNNPAEGKLMASNVKKYLVTKFRIDSSRITLEGRSLPLIPSEQKGAQKELKLLHQGDRRVDIISNASTLTEPIGNRKNRDLVAYDLISMPKDLLKNQVVFTNTNASTVYEKWNLSLTNEQGEVQQFGPYVKDVAVISGNKILGNAASGTYKVKMTGTMKNGSLVTKNEEIKLQRAAENGAENGHRFSILFEFDQAKSIATYEQFLTKVVGPYLVDQAEVSIHGHTDSIGDEKYNLNLSEERAKGAQKILETYLKGFPGRKVTFESVGYGEQEAFAPFDNNLPEERFYNRCVIIDIVTPN